MKRRNKIASIGLFVAALVIGFDAQPSWSHFSTLVNGYTQCDVATGFPKQVAGIAVLPDGTVLVADAYAGLFAFKPGSTCQSMTATLLSSHRYLGMAIGNDGQLYANDYESTGTKDLVIVSLATGDPVKHVLSDVHGLGMALDPVTGDLPFHT